MSRSLHADRFTLCTLLSLLIALTSIVAGSTPAAAAEAGNGPSVVYFPVTGHHVSDKFLSTWRRLGGLATFGYPLSEPLTDPDSGLTVQYFERERFELHPENAGTEYEVEFALLGDWLTEGRTGPAFTRLPADTPQPDVPNETFFPESGHYLSNGFKTYWETHGGLRIFGYPISEELQENGLTVQYFERARFEWHPENAGTPWEIELGRLGADRASAQGIDTAPVARQEGVPDYDESLWAPPPAEPRSISIPVLMYHRFGDSAERYQMPLWKFEQQLDWLQSNGYHAVTLTELYDYIAGTGSLPEKPVVLTFDDSPASQWGAVQALNARGMRGTFFVLTGQAGLENWQLQDMAAQGHEIDSHTIDHADLTTVSDDRLRSELVDSRAALQAITGQPVNFLAYPYGSYDSRVIATTQAAGYRAAVAAWGGSWWTPDKWWTEPRIEISGLLTLGEFAEFVR
jgi:hypothetical protein